MVYTRVMMRMYLIFSILFVCFLSFSLRAEEKLLKDVEFSVAKILSDELESYDEIISLDKEFIQKIDENDDTYKNVKEYFEHDSRYGAEQDLDRKERLIELASGFQYPLSIGIEENETGYSVFIDLYFPDYEMNMTKFRKC